MHRPFEHSIVLFSPATLPPQNNNDRCGANCSAIPRLRASWPQFENR